MNNQLNENEQIIKFKIDIFNIYRYFAFILGIIISFYLLLNMNKNEGYKFYFIVPLIYSIAIFIFKAITKRMNYIGMLVLNGIMLIKYAVMPLINCLADYKLWLGVTPKSNYVSMGVWLTIYEMIAVMLTIYIFSKFLYKDEIKCDIQPTKNSFVYKIVIISSLLFLLIFPELIKHYQLIFSTFTNTVEEVNVPFVGFFYTIIDFGKIIFILLIISYCKKKYDINHKFIYVLLAIATIGINSLITIGMSRWSIVIPGIILCYMLTKIFYEHRKAIVIMFGSFLFIAVVVLSIARSSTGSTENNQISTMSLWADTLQMYFSGPKNFAYAIETKNYVNNFYGSFPLNFLMNDFIRSVAFLSNFANIKESTIWIFNYFVYNRTGVEDQIIPLMGQSFTYFGFILSPILTVIATIIMMWLDKNANQKTDVIKFYIYSYMAIWFARAMMLNSTILFSHFINTYVLFIIIKTINDKIALKISKSKTEENSEN